MAGSDSAINTRLAKLGILLGLSVSIERLSPVHQQCFISAEAEDCYTLAFPL
jgi:hypothetical protein